MAYRNTIISLASVVALGTACSKAPSYNSSVQAGNAADQQAAAVDPNDPNVGHANDEPAPEVKTASNDTTAPATTTPTAPAKPATPPPAGSKIPTTEADLAKAANANGFIAYAVSAPNGQGWNTAATPYLIAPSVDAAGKPDAAKPFNVVFCNFSAGAMTIHSGGANSPMNHGKQFTGTGLGAFANLAAAQADLDKKVFDEGKKMADILAMPNCQANLVNNAAANNAGATYNHQGGAAGNAASYIYFKVYTADAAGVVTAK